MIKVWLNVAIKKAIAFIICKFEKIDPITKWEHNPLIHPIMPTKFLLLNLNDYVEVLT